MESKSYRKLIEYIQGSFGVGFRCSCLSCRFHPIRGSLWIPTSHFKYWKLKCADWSMLTVVSWFWSGGYGVRIFTWDMLSRFWNVLMWEYIILLIRTLLSRIYKLDKGCFVSCYIYWCLCVQNKRKTLICLLL